MTLRICWTYANASIFFNRDYSMHLLFIVLSLYINSLIYYSIISGTDDKKEWTAFYFTYLAFSWFFSKPKIALVCFYITSCKNVTSSINDTCIVVNKPWTLSNVFIQYLQTIPWPNSVKHLSSSLANIPSQISKLCINKRQFNPHILFILMIWMTSVQK